LTLFCLTTGIVKLFRSFKK